MAAVTDPVQIAIEITRRLQSRKQPKWAVIEYRHALPRLYAADGFNVSVQAGDCLYSIPRNWQGPWTHVEIGFPSSGPLLAGFEEYSFAPDEIWSYVPLEKVVALLVKHGGLMPHAEGES